MYEVLKKELTAVCNSCGKKNKLDMQHKAGKFLFKEVPSLYKQNPEFQLINNAPDLHKMDPEFNFKQVKAEDFHQTKEVAQGSKPKDRRKNEEEQKTTKEEQNKSKQEESSFEEEDEEINVIDSKEL